MTASQPAKKRVTAKDRRHAAFVLREYVDAFLKGSEEFNEEAESLTRVAEQLREQGGGYE